MSRQASMDQLNEDELDSGSSRVRRARGNYRMESQDSTASRDSMPRYAVQNGRPNPRVHIMKCFGESDNNKV